MQVSRVQQLHMFVALLIVLLVMPTVLRAAPQIEAARKAVQGMALATEDTVKITHAPVTGLASFVATKADRPIPLASTPKASVEERALAFVHTYGKAFGLQDAAHVRVTSVQDMDEVGMEHVRLQQVHRGVPVTAGEMTVHLRGASVVAVLAKTLADLDHIDTVASVTPDTASR